MPEMYVNPLPKMNVAHFLQFDFPADNDKEYRADGCLPNIKIEEPAIVELYGELGSPALPQGHPCVCESPPPREAEDPGEPWYHDQVLDIDRMIQIDHTGRLSGSFVEHLAYDRYHSLITFFVHPIGPAAADPIPLKTFDKPLTPGANIANSWYWFDDAKRDELLFTAHAEIDPKELGLEPENVYKLVCKWEFWDRLVDTAKRMPMSGFDEAVAFEVIQATKDF